MVPSILLSTLPIPSLILLLIITLYHLTPLLKLFSNLTPSLTKLSEIIPHPKKSKNLPREFFNLPSRPNSPSYNPKNTKSNKEYEDGSIISRLGVRGSLMLILLTEALISLATGWSFLSTYSSSGENINDWGLIATSLILLPTTLTWLTLFTILSEPTLYNRYHQSSKTSKIRKFIFKQGGITHSTLFPRILPLSIITSCLGIVVSSVLWTNYGNYCMLGYTSLCLIIISTSGFVGLWRMITKPREGLIRLRGESRMSLYEKEGLRERSLSPGETESVYRISTEILQHLTEEQGLEMMREGPSWCSTPSRPPTPVSSFDYSSPNATVSTGITQDSYKTPKSKQSNSSFAASASFALPQNTSNNGSSSNFTLSATTLVTPEHSTSSNDSNDISGSAAKEVINDKSWLSEPTNTPSSISAWSFPNSSPANTTFQDPTSPQPVITRNRSSSPINLPLSNDHDNNNDDDGRSPNLPRPGQTKINKQLPKTSNSTTYTNTLSSTPGSAMRSNIIDGSILADYSPDPFQPLPPRGFESLTSYPISSENLHSRISLNSRVNALRSENNVNNTSGPGPGPGPSTSSFTLHTNVYKTPDRKTARTQNLNLISTQDRRAPPPPPMPVDMPLPPTPTLARSSTLFEIQGKDSMELLLGNSDWVQVEYEEKALEDWGRGSKGVGILAVSSIVICYALSLPLLIGGSSDMAIILYLVSILLPSPLLAVTSYLLRYRPLPVSTSSARSKKGSTKTTSTTAHRSLALRSESQLSLPLSISPKLTPPAPNRASISRSNLNNVSSPTIQKMIEPKPSLTTFIHTPTNKSNHRRHTVYGGGLTFEDIQADENMRKTLARRSGDVWIQSGHAIEGGGFISRATEMLKPVPAMRVLESTKRQNNNERTAQNSRNGIVSMLAKRASSLFTYHQPGPQQQNNENEIELGQFEDILDGDFSLRSDHNNDNLRQELSSVSPARSNIAISIIAPSPEKPPVSKRRSSRLTNPRSTSSYYSSIDGENDNDNSNINEVDASYGTAEIGTATRGRMSNGPMFIFGKDKGRGKEKEVGQNVNGYELDWLTAGVLPGLVPSIRIGDDVRVGPVPHSAPASQTHYNDHHDQDTVKSKPRPVSDTPISSTPRDEEEEEEGNSSYATMPSFRMSSFKQSTPHGNSKKHNHTRSYSSSVDLNMPSEYFTAETATSFSRELRQRNTGLGLGRLDTIESKKTITHKASFGLPKLDNNESGFQDEVRKSIDDIQSRPLSKDLTYNAVHDDSIAEREDNDNEGIDLPPIPTTMTNPTLKHKPSLSRVSEMTEEPTLSISNRSNILNGVHQEAGHDEVDDNDNSAIFSQSALEDMRLALALGSSTPGSKNSKSSLKMQTISKSSDAPSIIISHLTSEVSMSISHSIMTNDEDLEEMERVMAMDTPTRAEFVISPPLNGRDSRASDRSSSTNYTYSTSDYTATTTTTTTTTTMTDTNINDSPAPPVPALPIEYRQPAYPTTAAVLSHPHPPPLHILNQQNSHNLIRQQSMPIINAHPPIQSLLPKRSTETLHSDASSVSASTSAISELQTPKMKAQKSRKELKLVEELNKRNSKLPQLRSQSSLGHRSKENNEMISVAEKRGLRPLTLVTDNNTNIGDTKRLSKTSSSTTGEKADINTDNPTQKFPILHEQGTLSKFSLSSNSRGKLSTGSTNTGKENTASKKQSKHSAGPSRVFVSGNGVRGLRS
ncbi:uncharacterized protein L201_002204 [Kwoniella dendrophila CBS 6074]|uniref:Uncharacterized protein n=1 Tax=Kwoniella dendrophila CBS 6074 TaxID=1295534 RepID=A0AAX4JRX0_9TREE